MKVFLITTVFLLSAVFINPVKAAEQPAATLNLSQMIKAVEVIQNNRELFNNPEALEALKRITTSLNQTQREQVNN